MMIKGMQEGRKPTIFFFQTFNIQGTVQHFTMPYGRNGGHLRLLYYIITTLKNIIHALKLHSLSSLFLFND